MYKRFISEAACFVCACACLLSVWPTTAHASSARETTNSSAEVPRWKTLWLQAEAGDCDALYELLLNYWSPEFEKLCDRREYVGAKFRELEQAAESGSGEACYMLALYNYYVSMDSKKAFYYFGKGAEAGEPECMIAIVHDMLFRQTALYTKDRIRELCLKAAQAGKADAYAYLALMYLYLAEKEIDPSESLEQCEQCLKMGEEAGSAMVWRVRGDMHKYGLSRPCDEKEAMAYYQIGAQKGNHDAQLHYGRYCLSLPDKESEGVSFLKKAAAQGNLSAIGLIGNIYFNGYFNVPQDIEKGILFTQFAACNGDAKAQYHFGRMLYLGDNVPQSKELGIEWLKRSAQKGDESAQRILPYILPTEQPAK